jgi:hypothetical protein
MTLHTAKGSFSASTFAALAAHQNEMQGAFASIDIGSHSVGVDGANTAEDMALIVRSEMADVFQTLADEAAAAGDQALAVLALEAIDTGDVSAVAACCAAICDAAA